MYVCDGACLPTAAVNNSKVPNKFKVRNDQWNGLGHTFPGKRSMWFQMILSTGEKDNSFASIDLPT